jgi:N-methylhydantoinase B
MLSHFGVDGIESGDVLLTNDAYVTGSHLNHITIVVPVFYESEIVGFSACMAHWQDIGGTPTGISLDIYSEGLQLPFLKLYRKGERNQELIDIVAMNVRNPELALGDLRAQVGAAMAGERRFREMIEKYQCGRVMGAISLILDQSDAAARAEIGSLPDGIYEAESWLDDDGVTRGERIRIKVRVVIAGDSMTVDLSDVSPQVKGYFNSGPSTGLAAAQVAFKCLFAGTEFPINDGCFRALNVILPHGTVVSATKPAPMKWWMTYPMTVVDTVFKALATACPQRVIAGHHADLAMTYLYGVNPRTGLRDVFWIGLHGGGWGAKHNEDGMSATVAINDGDTHNGPVEQLEAKHAILVERYALRSDSGGAGRQRGGLGTEFRVRLKQDVLFTTAIERVDCRPWGLFDGLSALGNEVSVGRKDMPEVRYPTGKLSTQPITDGEIICIRTGGGGGFGSPLDRPINVVEGDVREGYVTVRAAREKYGVVIDPLTGNADHAASQAHRAHLANDNLPKDAPFASEDVPEGQRLLQKKLFDEALEIERSLQSAGVPWVWDRCC